MKRFFITGTDTDCGKTYATCALLSYLKNRGKRVMGIKPLASGCVLQDGHWVSEDAHALERYSECMVESSKPWRFKEPVSPHLAAKAEGVLVTTQSIADYCASAEAVAPDYLLIEGAGGLMAPLNSKDTWLDFLIESQIPVILVVGMRLGCLNHALLTELALATHGITCIGWIANTIDKDMLLLKDNRETLQEKMHSSMLGVIPYQGVLEGDSVIDLLGGCCSASRS